MNGYKDDREYFDATCSECNLPTRVPFKPIEGRPVYCKECYRKRKPTNTY